MNDENRDRKSVDQYNRDTCYFCGSSGPIETHHIAPKRYGGGDEGQNLVDLCPTCHRRLERLYDDKFYATIGVGSPNQQVNVIHRHVSDLIEDTAIDVEIELRSLSKTIRENFVREDVDDLTWRDFKEMQGNGSSETRKPPHDKNESKKEVMEIIEEMEEMAKGDGAPMDAVWDELTDRGYGDDQATQILEQLRQEGEIYEPQGDVWRAT